MLTKRQELILGIIVADYTRTASPIASEALARNDALAVSAATIRNDVAALEAEGYIAHPHSSAGSVPLDKAYRFYVESLEPAAMALSSPARARARRRLRSALRNVDEWASVSAAALSGLVGNMAIATLPKARESRVRHIDLVHLQDVLVMLIVVLEQARLRRQLIRLPYAIDTAELEETTARLRAGITGLNHQEIAAQVIRRTPFEEELVEATAVVLRDEDKAMYRDHYVDGIRNLLSQPEFAENDRARAIIEGLEDGSLAQAILAETPDGGVVRVIIGEENPEDVMSPLSVVVCQYGTPHHAVGAVGVVGPTRMEYPKTMAGVKFVSSAMNELLESVHMA